MNRRELIRSIGAIICAGAVPRFIPSLVGYNAGTPEISSSEYNSAWGYHHTHIDLGSYLKVVYRDEVPDRLLRKPDGTILSGTNDGRFENA